MIPYGYLCHLEGYSVQCHLEWYLVQCHLEGYLVQCHLEWYKYTFINFSTTAIIKLQFS